MGHEGFFERFVDLCFVEFVIHMNHRTLTQRGERLVRRVRRIGAEFDFVRIRIKPRIQELFVLGIDFADLFLVR